MLDRRTFLSVIAAGAGSIVCRGTAGAETRVDLRSALAETFREAGTEGTFAALFHDALVMTDETRSRMGYLPASTFKIPHALIALETGVVKDVDNEIIRWDGVTRENEHWNKDHTLRSAMRYSVVPVFQQIARRIGAERMKQFVDAFKYGNRDISGVPIDKFWLEGKLRISALEQIDFLRRFRAGELPVAKRNLDLVRDIIPQEKTGNAVIRAKTGTFRRDGQPSLGWLVGFSEHGEDIAIFALNIDIKSRPHMFQRTAMARAMLKKIGALPA